MAARASERLSPIHIGILGAARIAPWAVVRPARKLSSVVTAAIAARNPAHAHRFANRHQIPHVHDSYDALLADPTINAIYIALPNSLHYQWMLAALRAGKHILCEKPFTANAREAEQIAQAAQQTDLVVMEAFHNLYHPLADAMQEVIHSGVLGTLRHIDARFCTYMRRRNDIRLRYELGGGATMDLGCYCVRLLRFLAGAEPTVTAANAFCALPQIDREMAAEFIFSTGATGRMTCTFRARGLPSISVRVYGTEGEMHVINPILPHLFNWVTVRTGQGITRRLVGGKSTYWYQLRAFVQAIQGATTPLTGVADAVANMQVIDAIYVKAGLKRRGEMGSG